MLRGGDICDWVLAMVIARVREITAVAVANEEEEEEGSSHDEE